jgi:hypothetical protein
MAIFRIKPIQVVSVDGNKVSIGTRYVIQRRAFWFWWVDIKTFENPDIAESFVEALREIQ